MGDLPKPAIKHGEITVYATIGKRLVNCFAARKAVSDTMHVQMTPANALILILAALLGHGDAILVKKEAQPGALSDQQEPGAARTSVGRLMRSGEIRAIARGPERFQVSTLA